MLTVNSASVILRVKGMREEKNEYNKMIRFLCCNKSQFTKLGFNFKLWFKFVRKLSFLSKHKRNLDLILTKAK